MMKLAAAGMSLAVLFAGSASANLVSDPSLDLDDSTGTPWGHYGAAGVGGGSAKFYADQAGNFGGIYQEGIAATPGVTYQLDVSRVYLESNFDAPFTFALEFYEADEATKISDLTQDIPLTTKAQDFDVSLTAAAPEGTAFVRPFIEFHDAVVPDGADTSGRAAYVNDVSITAVPEPASLGLLAGGALLLGSRRRRR